MKPPIGPDCRGRANVGLFCWWGLVALILVSTSVGGAEGGRRGRGRNRGGECEDCRRQPRGSGGRSGDKGRIVPIEETCNHAQTKCLRKTGCYMALQNYYMNCGTLINGETSECTMECKVALISLLSAEDGKGESLINCDCQGSEFCIQQKHRVEVCRDDVMKAFRSIHDDSRISCTIAEALCLANTTCMYAMEFYRMHCMRLFRGEKCTPKCNNSLNVLFRNPKGRKLKDCVCDGTERYDCRGIQTSTAELCYGCKRRHHRHHHHRHCNHGDPGGGAGRPGGSNPGSSRSRGGKNLDPTDIQGDDPQTHVCCNEEFFAQSGSKANRKKTTTTTTDASTVVRDAKYQSSDCSRLSMATGLMISCIILSSTWLLRTFHTPYTLLAS